MVGAFPGNYNPALHGLQDFSSNMSESDQEGGQNASAMFGHEVSPNQFSGASGPNNMHQGSDGVERLNYKMQVVREDDEELLLQELLVAWRRRQELQGPQNASAMFGQVVSHNQFAGASGTNNMYQGPGGVEERLNYMIQVVREDEQLLQLLIARRRRQELHQDQGGPAVTEKVMGDESLRLPRHAGNAAAASFSPTATAAMFNAERQASTMHPQSIPSTGLQGAHSNMMLSAYGARQTTAGSTMPSNLGQPGRSMNMRPAPPFLGMNSQDASGNLTPFSLGNTAPGRLGVMDDDYIDDEGLLSNISRQQHQEAMMDGVTEQQRQERILEHSPTRTRLLGNTMNPRNELNHSESLDGELVANSRGLEEFERSALGGGGDLGTMYRPLKKRKRFLKINKKPADMPRRPLSAYNIFFSEERERILLEIDPKRAQEKQTEAPAEEASGEEQKESEEANKGDKKEAEAEQGGEESTGDKSKEPKALPRLLLPAKKKKRPHRKTHGKISFQLLAQMVGQRWKVLSDGKRKYYQELAQEDRTRHERAMEEYYHKKRASGQSSKASAVDVDKQIINAL